MRIRHIAVILMMIVGISFFGCEGGGGNKDRLSDVPDSQPFKDFSWLDDEMNGILGLDDPDWRNYPDLKIEKAAIGQTVEGFVESMRQGDSDAAVQFVQSEKQEAYKFLFDTNPEAMSSFGDLIKQAQISFLSEHGPYESYNRTAEYAIVLDGFTFYVVFMKEDDHWVLYDF